MKLVLICLFLIFCFEAYQADEQRLIIPQQESLVYIKSDDADRELLGSVSLKTARTDYGKLTNGDAVNPKFYSRIFDITSGAVTVTFNFDGITPLDESDTIEAYIALKEDFDEQTYDNKCHEPTNKLKLFELYKDFYAGTRYVEINLADQLKSGITGRSGAVGGQVVLYKVSNSDVNGVLYGCGTTEREFDENPEPLRQFLDLFVCASGVTLTKDTVLSLATLVPTGATDPKTITELDLSSKDISCINDDTFKEFTALEKLKLNDNKLTRISNKLFKYNKALKEVYLQRNILYTLEQSAFYHNKALLKIYLQDNKLTEIKQHLFFGLTNLETVSLAENKELTELPNNLFPSQFNDGTATYLYIQQTGLDQAKNYEWGADTATIYYDDPDVAIPSTYLALSDNNGQSKPEPAVLPIFPSPLDSPAEVKSKAIQAEANTEKKTVAETEVKPVLFKKVNGEYVEIKE